MQRMEEKEASVLVGTLAFGVLLWVVATLTGCGLMGVRKADLWGAKFEFAEGLDFSFGANAIDKVDNRRGVSRLEDDGKTK